MCTKTSSRGSALILAVIAVLVVTTIGIAMLRMTYREVAGATAGAHQQALVACAEAARLQILSKFHVLGVQPDAIGPIREKIGTKGYATTWAVGAHYDTTSGSVQVEQVTALPANTTGPQAEAKDITNVLGSVVVGNVPWKVTAMCEDGSTGRKLEIEFGVKFGM